MRGRLQLHRVRLQIMAMAALLAGAFIVLPLSPIAARETAGKRHGLTAEEFSAQSRQIISRAPRRVRIYRPGPGPNSVRVCNAHYEQEYRPSGTVIVPRMQCYWSG